LGRSLQKFITNSYFVFEEFQQWYEGKLQILTIMGCFTFTLMGSKGAHVMKFKYEMISIG